MIRTISIVVGILLWNGCLQADESDIAALERDFYNADLQIINKVSNIPKDVALKLCRNPLCGLADYGEYWNYGDEISDESEPLSQHRFTGISDELAAVVYMSGGIAGPMMQFYLTRRGSNWACLYAVPPERITDVRTMGQFKRMLSPNRRTRLKCNVVRYDK